jgi:hypothetical protein
MRNAVIARDTVAQAAAQSILAEQGTAVDMALAGLLAGAARASSASLLGAAGVLLGGPGMGLHFVDGRARAPGIGTVRPRSVEAPGDATRAAVPGLFECVLAAHARFGTLPLSVITKAAVAAIRESGPDAATKQRLAVLEQFHRTGLAVLERVGVLRAILESVGPVAAGTFSADDLAPRAAPVVAPIPCTDGAHEVAVPPRYLARPSVHAPEALPAVGVEGLVVADMHGVIVSVAWLIAPPAIALPEVPGLALAALLPVPRKGVPRWRPGTPLPSPLPLAICRAAGRVWAGAAVSGHGDVVGLRDAAVTARLGSVGIACGLGDGASAASRDAVALWMIRDAAGDNVTGSMTALGGFASP